MPRRLWFFLALLSTLLACNPGSADRAEPKSERVGSAQAALTEIWVPGGVFSYGIGFSDDRMSTIGQVITAPPEDVYLHRFGFYFWFWWYFGDERPPLHAAVYEWNGSRAVGSPLFVSDPYRHPPDNWDDVWGIFETGGLKLVPGKQYVAFLTTDFLRVPHDGAVGFSYENEYPGGHFVWQQNHGDPSRFTTVDWNQDYSTDLSFYAVFDSNRPAQVGLVSSKNPALIGETVTFTATVSGDFGTPTGTVTLKNGATILGEEQLDAAGQASFATSTLPVSGHSITAHYSGDANYAAATSRVLSQLVEKVATTTTVVTSKNPVRVDERFTLRVTVTTNGLGTPTGGVRCMVNETPIFFPDLPLDEEGVAICELDARSYDIEGFEYWFSARYMGNETFAASASSKFQQFFTRGGANLALSSSKPASTFGESVTFTAQLSGSAGTPQGEVTFREGATVLGKVTLDASGRASIVASQLGVGTHSIIADYGGDATYAPAQVSILQQVSRAASSISLDSTTSSSVFGQSVTFTATVTGAGHVKPTGAVSFYDGETVLGVGALNDAGQASLPTAALVVGSHEITAVYAGDGTFDASTSASLAQQVEKASTTTTLVSAKNPSIVGSSVSFTATVAAKAPGAGKPSGKVSFRAGAQLLGEGTLDDAGLASFTTASLATGTHAITAGYEGDASFGGSVSSSLNQQVRKDGVTVALVSSKNPSTFGDAVELTATVSSVGTGGLPSGEVVFFDGATELGREGLDGAGSASFVTSSLRGGAHSLRVQYEGDANHEGGSSASIAQVVKVAPSAIAIHSSVNPSVFGEAVSFTATVTSDVPGEVPTGEVGFEAGTLVLGKATLDALGIATLTTSDLAVATHAISAHYLGDTNSAPSTALALSQVVEKAATSTSIVSSSNPAPVSEAITFTATVTATAPGSGTPSGKVSFFDGAMKIGSAQVDASSVARFTTSSLAVGGHGISAEYEGDGSFTTSKSDALAQNIDLRAASIAITTTPSPSTYGEVVKVSVTVSGPTGVATGTVTLEKDGATLITGKLGATGAISFSTTAFHAGTHTLTALYEGDGVYLSGEGSLVHVVEKASTTTTLASTKNPSSEYEKVTLVATVASEAQGFGGEVELFEDGRSLGKAKLYGDGATFHFTKPFAGGYPLIARYLGTPDFAASTSKVLTQTVEAHPDDDDDIGWNHDGGVGSDAGPSNDAGVEPEDTDADDAGCGCRIVTSGGSNHAPALLAIAGMAAIAVRRRRS